MSKAPLGIIHPCEMPACTIATNKRYQHHRVQAVACCPQHAKEVLCHAQVQQSGH